MAEREVNASLMAIRRAFGVRESVNQAAKLYPEEVLRETLRRLRDVSKSNQESEGTTLKVVFDSRHESRGLLSEEAIEKLSA